jgi:uncharacterized integral membrane protein (TIGR00698 family)
MIPSRYIAMLPGVVICGLIALISSYLGELTSLQNIGLSALTIAIILGIVLGNTLYTKVESQLAPGVGFSKHHLLRLGIILFGFRLTLQDVTSVGFEAIASDALVVCSTFFLALFVGIKLFKLSRASVILIGAGSSICGAAAVMAADGVVEAEAEDVSVAVSTVVVFGSIAMFLYPYLYQLNLTNNWIATDANAFGIYVGSTIHEVAQVVAAGMSINPEVTGVAVITKLVRVMMLAPFLLLLPLLMAAKESGEKSAIPIPWFAFIFIAMTVVNSMKILPVQLVAVLVQIDTIVLAMAMSALGLTTHLSVVRKAGLKPMLLALILFAWLIVGGALINRVVFWF